MANQTKEESIHQIYDSIFKRIFSLSNLSTINLINGLFGTHYPLDAKVEYPNVELMNRKLQNRYADIFIEIQEVTYHLEAQMKKDGNIVVRVFEYGLYKAIEDSEDGDILAFPDPVVIYLDDVTNIPEESTLKLDFGSQGEFVYRVKNYKYQDHEVKELNQKKMIVLIPFQLLKLKKIIKKKRTQENLDALSKLLNDDIIESIEANKRVGNITADDAAQLLELVELLYQYILKNYKMLGGSEEMKELLPGAIELPLDKYRIQIDELSKKLEERDKKLEERDKKLEEKDKLVKLLLEQGRQDELLKCLEDEVLFEKLITELDL